MSLVQIAQPVRDAIDTLLSGTDAKPESDTLSARYRQQPGQAVLLSAAGQRAYLATRFPATYAAARRAMEHAARAGMEGFETLLDAGCGPGTASLAAAGVWPELSGVTRSDLDGTWRPIADMLGAASGQAALGRSRWLTGAMDQLDFPLHDAVIAAYALNEAPAPQRMAAVRNLWRAAKQFLIIVEPGTPQGFLNIQAARSVLLDLDAHIVAPCTHHAACPMTESDWCHSSVRLARDPLHRAAKGGRLAYEDEKFAYLAVARAAAGGRAHARIVKRPVVHSGHLTLDLCKASGLERSTVSRRDGALYKAARKVLWGDEWPPD